MADNVAITAGSGTTVRTQDKGGAHVQVVQVDVGDDTTVTPLVLGQAAAAASVPVVIASDQGALTVGSHAVTNAGTFAVQESGGALTALQIMDDWDESDRAKVNLIVGQAGVAAGSGVMGATVLRVVQASDGHGVPVIVTPADSTFSRPADTTAYAIGDLVANNTTAGSVTPLSFTGATKSGSGGTGRITRWIGQKSGSVACVIRFHFLLTSHAVTNGDNGALVFTSLDIDNYLGAFDCVFNGSALTAIGSSSAEVSEGVPVGGAPIDYKLSSGDTIYVFAQAVSAFTPANGGTIGGRPVFEVLT